MINAFILIPFIIQAIVIMVDEGYFHLRRGLPLWERIGHPIDTATVLAAFLFILFVPFSALSLKIYIGLALFSCVMVTKDEFVHKHCCPASEQWLHAFLFLNHPVLLTSAGLIWANLEQVALPSWLICSISPSMLKQFLVIQTSIIAVFFVYQIIYWNFIWKEIPLEKK